MATSRRTAITLGATASDRVAETLGLALPGLEPGIEPSIDGDDEVANCSYCCTLSASLVAKGVGWNPKRAYVKDMSIEDRVTVAMHRKHRRE